MFYNALSAILLLPVFTGFGILLSKVFRIQLTEISLKMLLGVFGISIIYLLIAFFHPLGIEVELLFIAIGWSAFFVFKEYLNYWNYFSAQKLHFGIICGIILFFASFFPFILDHFGYYVPTIKWISEVGLVKGISNLDLLLGQTSIWHILQAGVSHFADPFLRLNGIVLIIYAIYIFEKKSWIQLVFLPVFFLFVQSPSPDLPAMVFSLMILSEILRNNRATALLFSLSIFVLMIKPTLLWLPIVSFLYAVIIKKSNIRFVIPGVLLMVLFCFKNIWTFGFPIFPVQILDFHFSWKPHPELLRNSSEMAILKTYDMQYSMAEIQNFSTFEGMWNWLFLKGVKGKIHLLFILSIMAFFLFAIWKRSRIVWIIFIAVLTKSIVVLYFSAQYRFFIEVFFVVFLVMFFTYFTRKNSFILFGIFSFVIGGFLSFPKLLDSWIPSFRPGSFMAGFQARQLYKPSTYGWNHYKNSQIGNLKFNIVKDYPFSFQTPIPAISPSFIQEDLDAGIFPQLQGEDFKEGFIWKKLSAEEKAKVQEILDLHLSNSN